MTWKQIDCTTQIETLRRFKELIAAQLTSDGSEAFRLHLPMHELNLFEKLQGIHFFSIDKQWFERMLIAPGSTRIETLRRLKKVIAFQLTSDGSEAF
jgi:hypothetical protein